MYHYQLMRRQLKLRGLRFEDCCSIFPFHGQKKTVPLDRYKIDIVSEKYRPKLLSMKFFELPRMEGPVFHYRLELDKRYEKTGRFILKTLEGYPFFLNGNAIKEAYLERMDVIKISENKLTFSSCSQDFHRYHLKDDDQNNILNQLNNKHSLIESSLLSNEALVKSPIKILIQGETGSGKSYLAHKVHERSGVSGKFVGVNLSSYNSQLIESELFGHKRGAFTGAICDKMGAFEHAENGTLFLDEVDSLPIEIQTKLLTFMDQNCFRKVGDIKERKIKTRLIFASGKDLKLLVYKGEFRKDFYYRLKSGHTEILNPLRQDPKKILEACEFFLKVNNLTMTERLFDFYMSLPWPGNLRQILGHLEKKKILSRFSKLDFDSIDDELLLESSDLNSFIQSDGDTHSLKKIVNDYIKTVLIKSDGSIKLAAKKLQVSEKKIRYSLKDMSDFGN